MTQYATEHASDRHIQSDKYSYRRNCTTTTFDNCNGSYPTCSIVTGYLEVRRRCNHNITCKVRSFHCITLHRCCSTNCLCKRAEVLCDNDQRFLNGCTRDGYILSYRTCT